MHKTTILCQFGLFFVTSLLTHISINSQPFLVGIVSEQTWETLSNIIAVYAKKHDLLNTPGWKLSKSHSKDNNKWKEATDLELEQIKEYQVFKDFGMAKAVYDKKHITNAPKGHQKIRVHFVFDVKHCEKFKASDRILTYGTLLDVLWQMYHPWITYGTVRRIV